MRGVIFTGNSELEVREFADPIAGPGEVVVRVKASGMCGSDLHHLRSPEPAVHAGKPIIQGHEPCGEIVSIGPGLDPEVLPVGKRVMIHHYWGCGTCVECRSGWPQLCRSIPPRITTLNEHGGHADYIKVPAIQTMALPDSLSFQAGAAIGCGTGTAWGGLARLGDIGGKTLVVLGQGPVGMSATMLASRRGARVIAVDVADARLAKATSVGAAAVINSTQTNLLDSVRDLTDGRGADLVLETSGATPAVRSAFDVVATWGTICLIGLGADVNFNTRDTLRRQLTIVTSWTLSTVQQIECADFIASQQVPVDELFSHSWRIDQAAEAYEWFARQSDGKGVFLPDGES